MGGRAGEWGPQGSPIKPGDRHEADIGHAASALVGGAGRTQAMARHLDRTGRCGVDRAAACRARHLRGLHRLDADRIALRGNPAGDRRVAGAGDPASAGHHPGPGDPGDRRAQRPRDQRLCDRPRGRRQRPGAGNPARIRRAPRRALHCRACVQLGSAARSAAPGHPPPCRPPAPRARGQRRRRHCRRLRSRRCGGRGGGCGCHEQGEHQLAGSTTC